MSGVVEWHGRLTVRPALVEQGRDMRPAFKELERFKAHYLNIDGYNDALPVAYLNEHGQHIGPRFESPCLTHAFVPIPPSHAGGQRYEWMLANWGTSSSTFAEHIEVDVPEELVITFKTQQGPPVLAFEKVSRLFPRLSFELLGVLFGLERAERMSWNNGTYTHSFGGWLPSGYVDLFEELELLDERV